jgi:hypothetical protein
MESGSMTDEQAAKIIAQQEQILELLRRLGDVAESVTEGRGKVNV